jgi:hypothetical protein
MGLTHLMPRWRLAGSPGTAPIGPAMTTLRSVIARLASVVRCVAIAYIAIQIVIWNSFYAAHPWCLAVPVALMAWAGAVTLYLRRRSPSSLFACLDWAVYASVALGAQSTIPFSIRDHAFSWLAIGLSGQLIIPAWYAPAGFSVPLAIASPLTYWAGAELTADNGLRATTATAIVLLMVAGIHLYVRRQLTGRAAAADASLARSDRVAREQYVILSRNIERREHERLLHDTILNTLTALARCGTDDRASVVSRCQQDVALIQSALGDTGRPGAGGPPGGLVRGIQGVAAQMRASGLDVHVRITGEIPAVPGPVTAAISAAAREALSNVSEHAGTGQAWIEISAVAPLGDQPGPGELRVTIRDGGAGFDPAAVGPSRLGLRRSIAERVADCGGQASIRSAPGQGTLVCLSWPRDEPTGGTPAQHDLAAVAGWGPAPENPPW